MTSDIVNGISMSEVFYAVERTSFSVVHGRPHLNESLVIRRCFENSSEDLETFLYDEIYDVTITVEGRSLFEIRHRINRIKIGSRKGKTR